MYVTNFNLGRIVEVIEIDINDLPFNKEQASVLSNSERLFLEKAREFFQNNTFKVQRIKPLGIQDTHRYVNEGKPPAYHINSDCEWLHKDWDSYPIPFSIKNRGDEAVENYRNFVRELDLGKQGDRLAVCAQFHISESEIGQKVERKNSGATDFEKNISKLSSQELQNQITDIHQQLESFSKQSEDHIKIYRLKYREPKDIKLAIRNRSDEIKKLAEEFSLLKERLILSYIEKLKKDSNFDQANINVELLKELGFRPCSCARQ
ncbi:MULTISPECIES: hypothetical protein [unclassified Moraxella]|uniref:hypothetical protein n=1 Tax=unclassified Moraxella TaxID=2685852 RepID=UPI003AF6C536